MKLTLVVTSLCLLLIPAVVKADIVGVSGQATVVSPPSSVEVGTGSLSLVFAEQSVVLPSLLTVDASGPGTYASPGSLTGGTISAGTDVNSYYLHSLGPNPGGSVFAGSITFSTPILGVEALDLSLSATNSILGLPTTTYYSGSHAQGFELGSQIDSFTISSDGLTLTYLDETFGLPDDLRIITAPAVPEPSSVQLLGMGILCVLCISLKKAFV
jgi:hypothetical protein